MSTVKRPYHAPIREEQAAQTRQRIAAAAAAEFADRGWAATTIAAIAARAGVTPQAVHLAVGGKAALLIRGVETMVAGSADDVALVDRPALRSVYGPGVSGRRRLEAFAATTSDIYQRAGRLFLVLQEAAAVDPTAAEMANQGQPDGSPTIDASPSYSSPTGTKRPSKRSLTRSGFWPGLPSTSTSSIAATGSPAGTPAG